MVLMVVMMMERVRLKEVRQTQHMMTRSSRVCRRSWGHNSRRSTSVTSGEASRAYANLYGCM
eukprot:20886-Eustigmatos_ZCMA.PRE.1